MILIPIVKITGFSEVLEEISKALAIFFLILNLPKIKQKIVLAILFGFLFGLSESFFYLTNIFQVGDFNIFWQRLLFVVPMHILTVLIILLPGLVSRKFMPARKFLGAGLFILGLAGAIVVHLVFNNFIAL